MSERAVNKRLDIDKWLPAITCLLAFLAYRDLVFWDSAPHIRANVTGWFYNPTDSSPQLLYALVIGLFYLRRKDIADALHANAASWSAVLFLMPGVCLYLWGHYIGVTDIVYMSFLLVGFGATQLLSGRHLTRVILPPALILVLAIPLPAALLNMIIFPLQLWTAEHSAGLLNIIGIPALAEGDVITMATTGVRVAESCTALGFIKWLTIFSLAYVYIFRTPMLHALVLVLSAPVIAYSVNLLRAFTLIINPEAEVLSIHAVQGIIFFLIGIALLYALETVLQRLTGYSGESRHAYAADSSTDTSSHSKHKQLLFLVVLFAALLLTSVGIPQWSSPPRPAAPEIELPAKIGEWNISGTPTLNYHFLGSVRYSSHLYHRYSSNDAAVSIFIGYDDRLRGYRSLLSDKNAFQIAVGLVRKRTSIDTGFGNQTVVSVLNENDGYFTLTWHWYSGVGSRPMEVLRALLALDRSPFRRPYGAAVIRLATNVKQTPQGLAEADARLRDFLKQFRKATAIMDTQGLHISSLLKG